MNIVINLMVPLSNLLAAIIGAVFAMAVFRGEKRSDTAREQLDKVYARAFQLIEPVMYRNISRQKCDELVYTLCEIAAEGGILSDPQFIGALQRYKAAPAGDESDYPDYQYHFVNNMDCYLTYWYDICKHIDRNYDILCRRAFLPIRKTAYRLDRKQYINRFSWLLNLLYFESPFLVFMLFIAVTILQIQLGHK